MTLSILPDMFAKVLIWRLVCLSFSRVHSATSLKPRSAVVKPQHLNVNVTAVVETMIHAFALGIHGANVTAKHTAKYSVIAGKGVLSGAKVAARRLEEGKVGWKTSQRSE